MAKLILLYDNFADSGTLSGGSWNQPLTNMQDPRPSRRAVSADLNTTSTQFKIALTRARGFKAIAIGPGNVGNGARYRITAWGDDTYAGTSVTDTGWVEAGTPPVVSLDLDWEDPDFWYGVVAQDDPDHKGFWVIHVFDVEVTAQYWKFEFDDPTNADGAVEFGRLYMGTAWEPTENFDSDSNSFGFTTATSIQTAAGGANYFNRRPAARTFSFTFGALPEDEMWSDVYRIATISNINQQVFVIPDPDDTDYRNKRSFLATLKQMPNWKLFNIENASTGFDLTEAL